MISLATKILTLLYFLFFSTPANNFPLEKPYYLYGGNFCLKDKNKGVLTTYTNISNYPMCLVACDKWNFNRKNTPCQAVLWKSDFCSLIDSDDKFGDKCASASSRSQAFIKTHAVRKLPVLKIGNSTESIAMHRPTQCSLISKNHECDLAVDSDYTTCMRADHNVIRSIPHSDSRSTPGNSEEVSLPWWRVDLLAVYVIERVYIVYGETDLLHDFVVGVGNEDVGKLPMSAGSTFKQYLKCTNIEHTAYAIIVTCPHYSTARYVTIQIVSFCNENERCAEEHQDVLSLCEVEVWGILGPHQVLRLENVGVGRSAKMSSYGSADTNGELALDNLRTNSQPELTAFAYTDDLKDTYPWWRVDLIEIFVVEQVAITTPSKKHKIQFHDIEIRIGSTEVESSLNELLLVNEICVSFPGRTFPNGRHVFTCRQRYNFGRYVSLQIIDFCIDPMCDDLEKNQLIIAECEIYGRDFSTQLDDTANIALRKPASQSSTVEGSNASLAVDGEFDRLLGSIQGCTLTDTTDPFPWWMVDFLEEHMVFRVDISTLATKRHNYMHDVSVRVGNDDTIYGEEPFQFNGICFEHIGTRLMAGTNSYSCAYPLRGRYLTIQVVRMCTHSICFNGMANVLLLCEVVIRGYSITEFSFSNGNTINVAFGKPVAVSSKNSDDSEIPTIPELAVDGYHTLFLSELNGTRCSHIDNVDDKFPWWRVDLQESYRVKEVVIHNRGEGWHNKLHHFEIRVGDVDIEKTPLNSLFEENALCNDPEKDPFPSEGRNRYVCVVPLDGRYVSIQITKPCRCRDHTCGIHANNILTLCEVFVWATHKPTHATNVALLKTAEQSATYKKCWAGLATDGYYTTMLYEETGCACAATIPDHNHTSWWRVDLGERFFVEAVTIFYGGDTNKSRERHLVIRVGNIDITEYKDRPGQKGEFFLSPECFSSINALQPGYARLNCSKEVFGRYVTIIVVHKSCAASECPPVHDGPRTYLCEVEVWGYKDKPQIRYLNNRGKSKTYGKKDFTALRWAPKSRTKNNKI